MATASIADGMAAGSMDNRMAAGSMDNGMAAGTVDNGYGMAAGTVENGMVAPPNTPNTTRKVPRWDLMELAPADNGNEIVPADVLSP